MPELNSRQFNIVHAHTPEGGVVHAYLPGRTGSGQEVGELYYEHNEHPWDFHPDTGEPTGIINNIGRFTDPKYRHRGVQTALQDELHRAHPDKPVVSEMWGGNAGNPGESTMTDDAVAFHEAYKRRRPAAKWEMWG